MGDGGCPPPFFLIIMARGKLGGTKAHIRGKVGDQIYQLKRANDGELVQSVYQAPENREYTNTEAQARARMIMGQIQRMFHILPDIIYNAFSYVAAGQQSFNYFAQLNYPLLKADMENNWAVNCEFDWREKRDVTAPAGIWKLTDGTLKEVVPYGYSSQLSVNNYVMPQWRWNKPSPTLADFYKCIGINATDVLNVLFYQRFADNMKPFVSSIKIKRNKAVPQSTLITNSWSSRYFIIEGDFDVSLRYFPNGGWFLMMIGGNNIGRDYILDCFGFLNTRTKKDSVLFSPCNFKWVSGWNQTLYQRTTPEVSFQTWLNP